MGETTVGGLLHRAVEQRGSQPYATGVQGELTIAELDTEARRAAAWLEDLGVSGGQRVAVLAANDSPGHLALVFALAMLRATWVPVNPRLTGDTLRHVLEDCDPALIVVAPRLRDDLPAVEATVAELEPTEWPAPAPPEAPHATGRPDDVLLLIYTSGTTGAPKGVQVTDRMWLAAARGSLLAAGAEPGDRLLMWEPWCHIGGAQVLLIPLLTAVRLAIVSRFSASRFWTTAREHGATHIHHLGGIAQILLRQEPTELDRRHGVRVSWGGGMDAETWQAMQRRFAITVRECYGMTETASVCTVNTTGPEHGIGRPVPGYRLRVVDDDDSDVPVGDSGRILVTGAGLITPGYFRRPEATAAARRGAWWDTGDRGRFDEDGNLHFEGRVSDSVRRRGENISASWVERALLAHPQVIEAAVVAVPSELAEEEILAYVVAGDPVPVDELLRHCRQRLADFEVPRYVRFVAGLPKTPSQRVAKVELPRDVTRAVDTQDVAASR